MNIVSMCVGMLLQGCRKDFWSGPARAQFFIKSPKKWSGAKRARYFI